MVSFSITFGRDPNRRRWQWPSRRETPEAADSQPPVPRIRHRHHYGPFSMTTLRNAPAAQRVTFPQDQCALFELPTELRLYIYQLSMRSSEPVDATELSGHHLSILQTCRRVLQEAEVLFYGMHRFRYSPHLLRIGDARLEAITAVTIVASSAGPAFS